MRFRGIARGVQGHWDDNSCNPPYVISRIDPDYDCARAWLLDLSVLGDVRHGMGNR